MLDLGDDEEEVLRVLRGRLELGQMQYGKLDIARDEREWSKELLEEVLDQCVYTAIMLVRILRKERGK
jgi:hypothetical protein